MLAKSALSFMSLSAFGAQPDAEAASAAGSDLDNLSTRTMVAEVPEAEVDLGQVALHTPGNDYRNGDPFNQMGGKTFIVGGAGNDEDGTYLPLLRDAFISAGISGVEIVSAEISSGMILDAASIVFNNGLRPADEYGRYAGSVDLGIPAGTQLNFVGYSYGGVQVAQTSLSLAYSGYRVDNVVLIGAPINQDLLDGLVNHPNIGQVTVLNLTEFGDPIYAGMPDYMIAASVPVLAYQITQGSGHFVYSQTGGVADARRDYLARTLYHNGIK
jgi:hypothetical protein